jgi:hypothetical protein
MPSRNPQQQIGTTSRLGTTQSPAYYGYAFGDYECTEDCSGHAAGYEWAEQHGIDDPDDCGGNSNSFIEGCQEYASEQRQSYDYGYEWAGDNDIGDESDCPDEGGDFYAGCSDFADENSE